MDKLTSQTMLCPPEQIQHALTLWSADHFEAMNKGDATAGLVQNTIWKLLLAHIPRRCSTNHELTLWFRLWRSGQHAALLERIEEQTHVAQFAVGSSPAQRAKRARRMSQCGAHRKGIQSLRGQVAQLSPAQQLMYANLLFRMHLMTLDRHSSDKGSMTPVIRQHLKMSSKSWTHHRRRTCLTR